MQGPMGVNGTPSRLGRTEAFFVVFLTWVAIYLPALGQPELKGEEGRRVLPAIAMLQTGDWLVPHVGGEAYYGKPPFVNWLVAGAFFLTGERNEQSARLPSVLLILTFVVLLIWLPGGWLSVDARIIGAIAFLTTIGMVAKVRRVKLE